MGRHVTSPETLFNHLRRKLGFPFIQATGGPGTIPPTGIIIFQNIRGFRHGAGGHIDCWNGRTYYNSVTATGAPSGNVSLFGRARRVRFCGL